MKWQSVQDRINYFLCVHMYNCIHGNAPQYLVNSIVMACDAHNINTRLANSLNVIIPECNSQLFKRSCIYRASILWNTLPDSLKECDRIHKFKHQAKHFFS